jgi:NDP-sugar pyrophosphorylase family protein
MRTVISIQGKNTRLGALFKTPKYNLLYKGLPAIERTVEYMSQFGHVHVLGLEGQQAPNLVKLPFLPLIDCLKTFGLEDDTFYIDCDVIPLKINLPKGDTVYTFKRNESSPNQYGNVDVRDGQVIESNEKGQPFNYCTAGIYFFSSAQRLADFSAGCVSLSQIYNKMIQAGKTVQADTTSEIFRFGTLHDITGI